MTPEQEALHNAEVHEKAAEKALRRGDLETAKRRQQQSEQAWQRALRLGDD